MFLDKSHALFAYNHRLNQTLITMNDENIVKTEKKFPSTDAKNALKEALKRIPKSFLLKVIFFRYYFTVFTFMLKYLFKDSRKASSKG